MAIEIERITGSHTEGATRRSTCMRSTIFRLCQSIVCYYVKCAYMFDDPVHYVDTLFGYFKLSPEKGSEL